MRLGESSSAFEEKPVTTDPVRCTYYEWGFRRSYRRPIAGRCRGAASGVANESPRAPSQHYGRVFRSCIRRFHLEGQLSRPMVNVTPRYLGISPGTSQVRAKVWRHLWIVVRPPLPHCVALDVLVPMWLN